MSRQSRKKNNKGFARTDRIGSTIREVIAEELTRIDDDAVAYVTVTDVAVDNELTRARVYFSTLDLDDADLDGVREHAGRLRKAVSRRAQLRHTPMLEFLIDPGLAAGTRVEQILRDMSDDRAFRSDEEE